MTARDMINTLSTYDDSMEVRIRMPNGKVVASNFACDSWRGSYDKPATIITEDDNFCDVGCVIANLNYVEGTIVTGWKGGEFTLSEDDDVFLVTDWGESGGSTSITSIDTEGDYILMVASVDQY